MNKKKDLTEVRTSSKQDVSESARRIRLGDSAVLNPTGKGGFGDNPDNRSSGNWKKEDTARFKLEQMMKLPENELEELADSRTAPLFERKLARAIIDGQWTVIKEMMDQVYGRNTTMDMNVKSEEGIPLIKGFVIPSMPGVLDDDETAA